MAASRSKKAYVRPMAAEVSRRLAEPRRFIQVISGARQVGKTTLIRHVAEGMRIPVHFASADEPSLQSREWIAQQWETARFSAKAKEAVLVLDEVQKVDNWPETVKRLWDEDTRARRRVKVVLLGSAPLLMRRGSTESLAGRFEVMYLPHWSAEEMRAAFGWTVDEYIFYGAYPGAAALAGDHTRWSRYIRDSLIETSISRDVLLLTRIDKPALLRRLFELGCRYSGQILSYTKMLGQLQDAGNTTTLAHYLELLKASGLLGGLDKFAGETVRQRASSPKLQVFNTALISAQAGITYEEARHDRAFWGRLTESAVGAHLMNAAAGTNDFELFYWRDGNREVDFVVKSRNSCIAIEVKSGRVRDSLPGLDRFSSTFRPQRTLLIGTGGIPIHDFLRRPVQHWTE